jgi:hypothetical protein
MLAQHQYDTVLFEVIIFSNSTGSDDPKHTAIVCKACRAAMLLTYYSAPA